MLKALGLLTVLILTAQTSVAASAADSASIPKRCYTKAVEAMTVIEDYDYYDKGGMNAYECELSPVGRAVVCKVWAEKGDGAAVDDYQVVMNRSCTRAFRVDLKGEE